MSLALALILDAIFGEPEALWRRVPHPAVVLGRAVGFLDARLNQGDHRHAAGVISVILLVGGAWISGLAILALPYGETLEILAAAILLAQRSLVDHVRAVALALRRSLPEGRRAVAMIVGRDVEALDGPGIARSAIESGAENLSDGVIAPAFWFFVGGLPAMLAYKAINTADSMIGYRTPRHEAFGWAAAKVDDLVNWIPARLTAVLILFAHGRPDLWAVLRRDAGLHRSPNAGWPEAAIAPILGVALSGPRAYEGAMRDFPWVYPEGRRDPGPADIEAACATLWRAWALCLALAILWGVFI